MIQLMRWWFNRCAGTGIGQVVVWQSGVGGCGVRAFFRSGRLVFFGWDQRCCVRWVITRLGSVQWVAVSRGHRVTLGVSRPPVFSCCLGRRCRRPSSITGGFGVVFVHRWGCDMPALRLGRHHWVWLVQWVWLVAAGTASLTPGR